MKKKKSDILVNFYKFSKYKLDKEGVADLMIIALSGVDWHRILWPDSRGELTDKDYADIKNAMEWISEQEIFIDDFNSMKKKIKKVK